MFDAIHTLSTAYGWTKKEILEQVYPAEIELYVKRIKKEKANERLTLLAITHNPHVQDPNKLIKELQELVNEVEGSYYNKQQMDGDDIQKLMEVRRRMMENAQSRTQV